MACSKIATSRAKVFKFLAFSFFLHSSLSTRKIMTTTAISYNAVSIIETPCDKIFGNLMVGKKVNNDYNSLAYLFTKQERSLIFFSLKKSSFFKSMILLNFPIRWSSNILNLFNIFMILNKLIILWFWFDVTI